MTQQAFFNEPSGRTDDPATLTKDEVDYTAEGPAVLGVMGLWLEMPERMSRICRVLHPSLGSGVWARAIAACYQQNTPYIVGVERRDSERANAIAACGDAYIMDFEDFIKLDGSFKPAPFDLVVDNIPFSGFPRRDKKRRIDTWGWHIELLRAGLLTDDAIVAFYGLTQMGQGEAAQASMREWSPMLALRYGGRNEHRGEGTERLAKIPRKYQVPGGPTEEMRKNGGDSREYTMWVWSVADLRRRREQLSTVEGYKAWAELACAPVASACSLDTTAPANALDAQICRLKLPRWETVQLPVLPKHLRCWSPDAVPGTRKIPQETVDTVAALLRGAP